MDDICVIFVPNMWSQDQIKHALPYMYQSLYHICAQSPTPHAYDYHQQIFCLKPLSKNNIIQLDKYIDCRYS